MRRNPLLIETLRGLRGGGALQLAWLNAMVLQALVLLMWWPKRELHEILQRGEPPDTLLAMLVVLGLTLSWHALRCGGEERLLEGQQALREWAIATALPLRRIVAGQVLGQLVHGAHALALSAPLLLVAMAVCGAGWLVAALAVPMLLVQALAFRLGAAWLYLYIGHHGTVCFLGLRAAFVVVYGACALWLPAASHPVASHVLLQAAERPALAEACAAALAFTLAWSGACVVLGAGLRRALALERARPQIALERG